MRQFAIGCLCLNAKQVSPQFLIPNRAQGLNSAAVADQAESLLKLVASGCLPQLEKHYN
jgi:hypothetical protein